MKSLVFSQKVRKDGTYFLKVEDGESESVNERVDAVEYLVAQKLKAASTKLAFADLGSHPLDVGARIDIHYEVESEDVPFMKVVRYDEGELVESRELVVAEEIPLVNRTTSAGSSDTEHSVIGSLNILARAPEDEVVLSGVDMLVLDGGFLKISVDTTDASEVVGGFGTPSVLGAWATLQLFRESLEAHTGEEEVTLESYDEGEEYLEEYDENEFSRF